MRGIVAVVNDKPYFPQKNMTLYFKLHLTDAGNAAKRNSDDRLKSHN